MKLVNLKNAGRWFAAVFILTVGINGQTEGNPEIWCRNGFFPRENADFKIAKIKGRRGEKIHFYGDATDDCPGNQNCRLKSYLIPNDEVIVSRSYKNYVCAWFQPEKGSETVGWLPSPSVGDGPEKSALTIDDWLGDWRFYDNSIRLAAGSGRGFLAITGTAIWKGLGDNVHAGELDDEAEPVNNVLKIGEKEFGEEDCRVTMRLLGRYLIVSDNLKCGGANVTFSGVYRKK